MPVKRRAGESDALFGARCYREQLRQEINMHTGAGRFTGTPGGSRPQPGRHGGSDGPGAARRPDVVDPTWRDRHRARPPTGDRAPVGGLASAPGTVRHRVCGKPRSTELVAGSGQRVVTTLVRV